MNHHRACKYELNRTGPLCLGVRLLLLLGDADVVPKVEIAASHADAICKATELAVHRDNEIKRAATERAELTAENNKLTRQLQEAKGG